MKIEELFADLEENIRPHYQKVIDCLTKIEELLQDRSFEEAEELPDAEYDRYCELNTDLKMAIIRIIKLKDEEFSTAPLQQYWGNPEYWKEIEEDVEQYTSYFLEMREIRHMPKDDRLTYYQHVFDVIYYERENMFYAEKALGLPQKDIRILFRLIRNAENLIIQRELSERRFKSVIVDNFGICAGDAEYIWEMFTRDRDRIEMFAIKNQLNDLNSRISQLTKTLQDLCDNVDLLSDLLFMDMDDAEEK